MIRAALIAGAALALSGCATKLTGPEIQGLVDSLHKAGCGGEMTIDVRGGTGQLGGSASGQFTLNGSCPEGDIPPAPGALNPAVTVPF